MRTGFLLEDGSGHVQDLACLEEAFGALVKLLRAKHERPNGEASENATFNEQQLSIDRMQDLPALPDTIAFIELPKLSLRHEGHLKVGQNRLQAEHEAAALLSRSIRVPVELKDREANASVRIEDLPKILMSNMYESFAILVDSRLRVYAKVFFRHLSSLVTKQADAFGILQMGQKLETLQDIGGQITALSTELHMELEEVEPEEVSSAVYQQALMFVVTMDLFVPSPAGQSRSLAVRHKAHGHLKARVRDEDKKFEMTLEFDANGLLKSMMDQASLMVAQIVETTNEAFSIPEPKLQRGESFFVMPPPSPRKRSAVSAGLDLLSEAANAKDSVIITPDLQAKTSDVNVVPPLHLEDDEQPEEEDTANVDDLSLDQCASIVDDVFGAMDDAILQGPSFKKSKATQ